MRSNGTRMVIWLGASRGAVEGFRMAGRGTGPETNDGVAAGGSSCRRRPSVDTNEEEDEEMIQAEDGRSVQCRRVLN